MKRVICLSRQLLPDGPELIERFIAAEGDVSSRRSAFLFLYNEAEELAIDFLNDHMEDVRQQTGRVGRLCSRPFVIVSYLNLVYCGRDGLCGPLLGGQIVLYRVETSSASLCGVVFWTCVFYSPRALLSPFFCSTFKLSSFAGCHVVCCCIYIYIYRACTSMPGAEIWRWIRAAGSGALP